MRLDQTIDLAVDVRHVVVLVLQKSAQDVPKFRGVVCLEPEPRAGHGRVAAWPGA